MPGKGKQHSKAWGVKLHGRGSQELWSVHGSGGSGERKLG